VGFGVTGQRVRVGRDVRVVGELPDGVELQGPARVSPGRLVEVTLAPAGESKLPATRRAMVCSWRIVGVGAGGPMFRGICRWS
jgi:hypothetical protein